MFHPAQIKCPTGINFYHLVSLELNTSKRGWSNLLAYMLDSSPKLQILKLIIDVSNLISLFSAVIAPILGIFDEI